MPAQMTSTAWGQGVKNMLTMLVPTFVVWGLIAAAVVLIFEQPIIRSMGIAVGAIGIVALAVFFGSWLYGRSVGGRVLLDCGPHPTRGLFLLEAAFFLGLGLLFGAEAIFKWIEAPDQPPGEFAFGIALPAFMIVFVPYWLILATGRLQVREGGVWQYWALLGWNKIGSYRWANDATLLVRAKGFFSFFQGALPVPPEQKQAVEELLAKNCPAAADG